MKISEQFKPIINSQGVNVAEIAERSGYTPQYIYGLLSGNRRWNESSIQRVCEALDLEVKLIPKKKERGRRE